ncbi:MAG: PorT family protein [Lachnospiraceae bacterium]|nr:PorT family protein [Prevotella sp.]MCM1074369.1 PorT family protein [Ruminococcus sp.]MCM1225351.1 PorT family protein [Lachnospiraceae bacterium]
MKLKHVILSLLCISGSLGASAQEWIDTDEADDFISFGVRMGFNTANATRGGNNSRANLDAWGTGFNAGAVINLNFNNAVSIQPGFFFQSRSHNYSYVTPAGVDTQNPNIHEYGHTLSRSFMVPIMGIFNMYPTENIKWSLEFGPYFNFGISGSDKGTQEIGLVSRDYKDGYFDNRKKFDFGFKMGTGVTILEHYYLGVHYECGACEVWKHGGGRNKAWTFTLGYDF